MEDKIMKLEACRYADLAKHTKVFNALALEYHLWIYLDPEDVRTAYFIGAEEIGPNADNSRIFPDTFYRDSQCWIRVNRGYLGDKCGKHTIKLNFVERYTDTDFSLYVSYYMQNDNPDKPYVYMHKEDGQEVSEPASSEPTFTPYTRE